MSMAEDFRALRDFNRQRKAVKRSHMGQSLHAVKCAVAGLPGCRVQAFSPEHYRVYRKDGTWVDYWPGTGTWRSQCGKRRGSGVKTLLNEVKTCGVVNPVDRV